MTGLVLYLASLCTVSAQYPRWAGIDTLRTANESMLHARGDSQQSMSTELFLLSHDDFCLYGPPDGAQKISETDNKVVSWCSKAGHGTRLIPDGTLHGVTYVKTPSWVQVSGYGDFTNINIAAGDAGGQFDSSTHMPDGAKMTMSQGGDPAHNWVTLISADTFCVRACTGDAIYCPTQYDEMGCFFLTSNGVGWDNVWQNCEGDDGAPPGQIDGVMYNPGDPFNATMPIPPVSNCKPGPSVSNGQGAPARQSSGTPTGGSVTAASTSWVAVPTCMPCSNTIAAGGSTASAAAGVSLTHATSGLPATASSGSPGGGVTQQVGVTQAAVTGVAPAKEGGDLVARDGETTTSNGQCCFTTWTPSVIGGATARQTGQSTSGSSGTHNNGTVSADPKISSQAVSAVQSVHNTSVSLTGTKTASATVKVNGTGVAGVNGGKNGTNDTSFALERVDVTGMRGLGAGAGALVWTCGVTGVTVMLGLALL
ncbi:hypothetical protein IAU60_004844 [Kwoniella sp. DSM 27419]